MGGALMGTVVTFRLPGNEPRRQQPDRRTEPTRIDSRRSLIDPHTIKVPVLRHPTVYDWRIEGE